MHCPLDQRWFAAGAFVATLAAAPAARASDHLDTPTVIADPSADIGDRHVVLRDRRALRTKCLAHDCIRCCRFHADRQYGGLPDQLFEQR